MTAWTYAVLAFLAFCAGYNIAALVEVWRASRRIDALRSKNEALLKIVAAQADLIGTCSVTRENVARFWHAHDRLCEALGAPPRSLPGLAGQERAQA